MEELKERIDLFLNNEFFEKRPSLIEEIMKKEIEKGIKLPTFFEIKELEEPEYIGEYRVEVGKVHTYYFFGIIHPDGFTNFKVFENKSQIKLYFLEMNADKKDIAFYLNLIELFEE